LDRLIGEASGGEWELLLISGGAGAGEFDFGERALAAMGFHVHFRLINVRPGKPLVFGTRGGQAAFVIPGNPVSHFVVFHLAIRLALERIEGADASMPYVDAILEEPVPEQRQSRETYWPARVAVAKHRLSARPIAWNSSGDIRGLIQANGLIYLPPYSEAISAGHSVRCLIVSDLFSS
jgi:molybdopterin molybdotransferase